MQAFKCGYMIRPDGSVARDQTILVENGKILRLGADLAIPADAEVVDCRNQWISPGLIDPAAHLGYVKEPTAYDGELADCPETSDPIMPQFHVLEAFDPCNPSIQRVMQHGFTTVFCEPGGNGFGGASLLAGQGGCLKLRTSAVADRMYIAGTEQVCIELGDGPKMTFGMMKRPPYTRPGQLEMLRSAFDAARSGAQDRKSKVLMEALNGTKKVRITAQTPLDIANAIRLGSEYELSYLLEGLVQGYLVPELLSEANVPCIVEAMPYPTYSMQSIDLYGCHYENAASLEKAGLSFALSMREAEMTASLPIAAGRLTAYGLGEAAARRAITIRAAELLGISGRTGSLEAEKDADFAVFTGDPIDNTSCCTAVYIDGVREYLR